MTTFQKLRFNGFLFMVVFSMNVYASNKTAPEAWSNPKVLKMIPQNILFLPISHESVRNIPIKETNEDLVDLFQINNNRIKPLSIFNEKYTNSYDGYSKVRRGVYMRLVRMLEILPKNIGIAYFEGYRPLQKQKEYFDEKFKEILVTIKDKQLAYQETSKLVSPFIDNIPTHATGAAIDMTLFEIKNEQEQLLDMGKFDVIFGPNNQQETFSQNTNMVQRKNRLMLLEAAAKAGLVNYGYEWWHYSYGDKAWAFAKQENQAIYGLAANKDDPILLMDKETYLKGF